MDVTCFESNLSDYFKADFFIRKVSLATVEKEALKIGKIISKLIDKRGMFEKTIAINSNFVTIIY